LASFRLICTIGFVKGKIFLPENVCPVQNLEEISQENDKIFKDISPGCKANSLNICRHWKKSLAKPSQLDPNEEAPVSMK
jgi:hypothetical protein